MNTKKRIWLLLAAGFLSAAVYVTTTRAEKNDLYTSNDEFLPLGSELGGEWASVDHSYLMDEESLRDGTLESITFLKEKGTLLFTIGTDEPDMLRGMKLYRSIEYFDFPPRMVLVLYGVRSEEHVYRFFTEGVIRGIVLNPFLKENVSEYVLFFEDTVELSSSYDETTGELSVSFTPSRPAYRRGFGIRIADTGIDPLPQIVEIKKELSEAGLENFLLIASDHETVVLESPFYETREEAISYMESLESFGYNGKLAIREHGSFPRENRVDVVSEIVITDTDDPNLLNAVMNELNPTKLYKFPTERIYKTLLPLFSPSVREDSELLAENLYGLSELYLNYPTEGPEEKERACTVSLKLLEIVYFRFPDTERADDALWDMANLIRRFWIRDRLTEEQCYRRIIREYPESLFFEESLDRLENL
jgi:hypothetical protein